MKNLSLTKLKQVLSKSLGCGVKPVLSGTESLCCPGMQQRVSVKWRSCSVFQSSVALMKHEVTLPWWKNQSALNALFK